MGLLDWLSGGGGDGYDTDVDSDFDGAGWGDEEPEPAPPDVADYGDYDVVVFEDDQDPTRAPYLPEEDDEDW